MSVDPAGVAVIGMSCRFPGASDPGEFWRNLRDGVESVRFFDRRELAEAGVEPELLDDPSYVSARPTIGDVDRFDAGLFGFTPLEAEMTDPQQRLLLQAAWAALEDAGHDPERFDGRAGVYAGMRLNTYLLRHLLPHAERVERLGALATLVGNDKDYLASRIAYKLGLTGPAITLQTACSTGLVAVHLACESLLSGECDLALAGGVAVELPRVHGYLHQEGGIASRDGHTRTFDAASTGTVFGDGLGLVVLRRLEDALADRDRVRAVVLGSAVNNDGSHKAGFTAPGEEGQAEVVAEALAVSGVEAATVGYVEAHGTGTPVGDPIEVRALSRVYRDLPPGSCALGSVKSNFGHLDTAAGIAGFIKAVLCLEHGEIPPHLHFETPNPELALDRTPFYIPREGSDWPRGATPRRAAVSSFGIGGTNAHVILEEPPEAPAAAPDRTRPSILTLSGRDEAAVERSAAALADRLDGADAPALADAAFTLQVGRRALDSRRVVVARDRAEAVARLRAGSGPGVVSGKRSPGHRPVVLAFPGQGTQFPGMGHGLYRSEPVFGAAVDECAERLVPELGLDLRSLLYPEGSAATAEAAERLRRTDLAQPALFVVEHALARLWTSWGVEPEAAIGHSLGEYVAAWLAGVFSLDDALRLVAVRGRLLQTIEPGAMLAVPLSEDAVAGRLGERLAVAAVEGPSRVVVSGPEEDVARLEAELAEERLASRRLDADFAFHSAAVEPVLDDLAAAVERARPEAPEIPFVSNVTGRWIEPEEATDPGYWARHARSAVRFHDGLATLFEEPRYVLVEAGPGRSVSAAARRIRSAEGEVPVAVASLAPADGEPCDVVTIAESLGRLWIAGAGVDWEGRHREPAPRRVPLPTYPFARDRYWVEPPAAGEGTSEPVGMRVAGTGRETSAEPGFHLPVWQASPPPVSPGSHPGEAVAAGPWIVVSAAGDELGERVSRRLEELGARVVPVDPDPDGGRMEEALGRALDVAGDGVFTAEGPVRVLHLLAAGADDGPGPVEGWGWADPGLLGLPALARQLAEIESSDGTRIGVVTGLSERLAGDRYSLPGKAVLLGPCRAVPWELPGVECRPIDVDDPPVGSRARECMPDRLIAELAGEPTETFETRVAWRGDDRWVRAYRPAAPPAPAGTPSRLREEGVYLIVGGLGELGLEVAAALVEACRATLVLTGREHSEEELDERTVRRLRALEERGGTVLTRGVDVTDREAMAGLLAEVDERFGGLHGVLHLAGVAGGDPLAGITVEAASEVLSPKVRGARVLAELTADRELDFVLFFGSTIAATGGTGQAAYAGANAFLDAFARELAAGTTGLVATIDWPGWADIGMSARAERRRFEREAVGRGASDESPEPVDPPLLDRRLLIDLDRAVYATDLDARERWELSEHRVMGTPVLPGVAYLEMMAEAVGDHTGASVLALEDAAFLAPLPVPDGGRVTVITTLERDGEGFDLRIETRESGTTTDRLHARARVRFHDGVAERRNAAPPAGLTPVSEKADGGSELLHWGRRWQSLEELRVGDGCAWALLGLPADHTEEADRYILHPALFDRAVSCAVRYLVRTPYLPVSYRKVVLHRPLPARVVCRTTWDGVLDDGAPTLAVDVELLTEEGDAVATVEGFTMRRVGEGSGARAPDVAATRSDRVGTADGLEALLRILHALDAPRVVVSPEDPDRLRRRLREAGEAARSHGDGHDRPDLDAEYAPPEGERQEALAAVWRQVLGIDRIGVDDNFFELGGDSLLALQAVSSAGKAGIRFDPNELFRHPTIRELAALGAEATADANGSGTAADGSGESEEPVGEFPLARLGEDELDAVLSRVGGAEREGEG